jgi:serpin B
MRKTIPCAAWLFLISSFALPATGIVWLPFVTAYNDSGQRLLRAFASNPGNIAFSPYSIGTAMAMLLSGARGDNQTEMAKVLNLQIAAEDLNAANATALANLNGASSSAFQLRIANALFLTTANGAVSEGYVTTVRDQYAGEVFRGNDLATVNDWVRQKTEGKIDSILDHLDPSAAAILLDAIYLKAAWQKPFVSAATRTLTFHLVDGETPTPMMYMRHEFALAERPGYRAIRLPYANARFAMIVVLPDGNLTSDLSPFASDEIPALLEAFGTPPRLVDLWLPRFHASFKTDLVSAFTAMGMHRAFDPQNADFSGITGTPQAQDPLVVDQIAHRAVIDVTEQGTEAAAATGIGIAAASAARPQPVVKFTVDRPFLFAILDDETGAILFEGRIVDPAEHPAIQH